MWLWEVNQYRRESEEGDMGTAKMTRNGVGEEGVRISTRAGGRQLVEISVEWLCGMYGVLYAKNES